MTGKGMNPWKHPPHERTQKEGGGTKKEGETEEHSDA